MCNRVGCDDKSLSFPKETCMAAGTKQMVPSYIMETLKFYVFYRYSKTLGTFGSKGLI